MIFTIPLPQMLQTMMMARAATASSQLVLALLMAEGARIRPMEMMMGPVTTGGKNRITLFTPKRWMSPATATYTRPAATTPPQA